jgi:FMN phosphatase YigB (HAD superfamily)
LLAFDHTNAILSSMEKRGLALGIISDGNLQQEKKPLDAQTFLSRFKVVVMSDNTEVGG